MPASYLHMTLNDIESTKWCDNKSTNTKAHFVYPKRNGMTAYVSVWVEDKPNMVIVWIVLLYLSGVPRTYASHTVAYVGIRWQREIFIQVCRVVGFIRR